MAGASPVHFLGAVQFEEGQWCVILNCVLLISKLYFTERIKTPLIDFAT